MRGILVNSVSQRQQNRLANLQDDLKVAKLAYERAVEAGDVDEVNRLAAEVEQAEAALRLEQANRSLGGQF